MYPLNQVMAFLASMAGLAPALPEPSGQAALRARAFDIHGHRGSRGHTVENTLPAFAWGMIHGARTLELDNGVTADGVVVVWHDESITAEKCIDTAPAFADDPDWPYVGKLVANLTLAQLQTLDCGSRRVGKFPFQITYPGTRISTLAELFDFVSCADPTHQMLFNIESKIDAEHPEKTVGVHEFVTQHAVFMASPYRYSITFQSFDWRTLVAMKQLDPAIITSALVELDTAVGSPSPWLAGLRLDDFGGSEVSVDVKIARAAAAVGADILSPADGKAGNAVDGPVAKSWSPFTTQEMIDEAHQQGMLVKPWTVNNLTILEQHIKWGIDGVITDYPHDVRQWAKARGLPVAPTYNEERVLTCLDQALRAQRQ